MHQAAQPLAPPSRGSPTAGESLPEGFHLANNLQHADPQATPATNLRCSLPAAGTRGAARRLQGHRWQPAPSALLLFPALLASHQQPARCNYIQTARTQNRARHRTCPGTSFKAASREAGKNARRRALVTPSACNLSVASCASCAEHSVHFSKNAGSARANSTEADPSMVCTTRRLPNGQARTRYSQTLMH